MDLREGRQNASTCGASGDRGTLESVNLAGVEVSASAATQLACLLQASGEDLLGFGASGVSAGTTPSFF